MSMESAKPAYRGALPKPTPETQPFWDAAKAHTLVLPWCRDCGRPHFYPRSLCPHCLSRSLEWRQASGKGTLYSYVINHKPAKGFDTVPYAIGVVALAEGPRMLSNIVTAGEPTPDNLRIDMNLDVFFDDVTDTISLPKFRPVAS